jgi:uridine phosphorylase
MNFPNVKEKVFKDALFNPGDYVKYAKEKRGMNKGDIPEKIILCYHPGLLSYVQKLENVNQHQRFITIEVDGVKIGVVGHNGIGAPAAVVHLEELIAQGGKEFLLFGFAGTLQKNIDIADLIVCDRAIRDEGCSYHYKTPEKYANGSSLMAFKSEESLKKLGHKFHRGSSWTTDAPYRETVDEIKEYQEEGVLSVEMEASALFTVAEYRGVDLSCIFMVSDSLADLKWNPQFHNKKIKAEELFKIVTGPFLL